MSSSNEIFSIPELLELILWHVTAKDLLLQQRVSKTWQDVIQRSRSMQRKLHYDVELLEEDADGLGRVVLEDHKEVRWNPFMKSFWIGCKETGDCCQKVDLEAFKTFDYPTASWKTMYMTCPAVRTAAIFSGYQKLGILTSQSGITIGKLAETQQEGNPLRVRGMMRQQMSVCFAAFKSTDGPLGRSTLPTEVEADFAEV